MNNSEGWTVGGSGRRFNYLLQADPSVVLGQLGDVLPAACPGSSQQAEHEACPVVSVGTINQHV